MRHVLFTAALSGLIGGGGFLAGRFYPPATPGKPTADEAGARALAAELVEKLKTADPEKFAAAVYANTYLLPDAEVVVLKASLVKAREQHAKSHGKSTGEFELIRDQTAGPAVVRLVYLERFERGGVAWYFVLCRGSDGWKVADVKWDPTLAVAFTAF